MLRLANNLTFSDDVNRPSLSLWGGDKKTDVYWRCAVCAVKLAPGLQIPVPTLSVFFPTVGQCRPECRS